MRWTRVGGSLVLLLVVSTVPVAAQLWLGRSAIGVRVMDQKGKPVVGAEVRLRYTMIEPADGPPPLTTNGHGEVSVGGLAEGEWAVEISHPDYMTFVAGVLLREGKRPDTTFASHQAVSDSDTPLKVRFFKTRGELPPGVTPGEAAKAARAPEPLSPADALLAAVGRGDFEAAEGLLERGAPVNARDPQGHSALAVAVERGDLRTVRVLLSHGAAVGVATPGGATPLMLAADHCGYLVIESLLVAGANPNAQDPSGDTALHRLLRSTCPVEAQRKRGLELLVRSGARVDVPNRAGRTPAQLAEQQGVTLPGAEPRVAAEPGAATPPSEEATPAAPPPLAPVPTVPPSPRPAEAPPEPASPEPAPAAVPTPMAEPTPVAPQPAAPPQPAPAESAPAETAAPMAPAPPAAGEERRGVDEAASPPAAATPPETAPRPAPELPEAEAPAPASVVVPEEAPPAPTPPVPPPVPEEEAAPMEAPPPPAAPTPPAPRSVPTTSLAPVATTVRSYKEGTCYDCKPGEWAATAEVVAGAGGDGRACGSGVDEQVGGAVAGLVEAQGRGMGTDLIAPLSQELRIRLAERGLTATVEGSPCQLLAVVLPEDLKYTGFRYEASDAQGAGDCLPDQACPIGEAVWLGNPGLERRSGQTVVYGLFRNDAAVPRRARLTVYFAPQYRENESQR